MAVSAAAYLLGLGFTVGLSGALIPGPLLVYTINESLRRGRWTGLKVIFGHAIVEVIVIAFLALGLAAVISSKIFTSTVSVLGGLMLVLMGARSLLAREAAAPYGKKTSYGLVLGGTVFTAVNPSFPLWWATAGMRLLIEGYTQMGYMGVGVVVVGHWLADFGWYVTVSHVTARNAKALFKRGWYTSMRRLLSAALIGIGAYFIASVL